VNNWQAKFWPALILSLGGYVLLGYGFPRTDFLLLVSVYLVVFAAYVFLVRNAGQFDFQWLFLAAVLFRLCFLFSVPALSDDYFRFLWDGKLTLMGVSPYAFTPSAFFQSVSADDRALGFFYANMNSRDYFSVYPPVLQFIFATAVQSFPDHWPGAVMMLRLFCFAAELGTLFLLKRILHQLSLSVNQLGWYALNPLVITELSGNIHFEAVMIFLLLLSLSLLLPSFQQRNRPGYPTLVFSAVAFAFAVAAKLLPLLFLPFFIRRLGILRSVFYFLITGVMCLLLFLPFIDIHLLSNLGSSIDLYFRRFEFNAGMYYLIRWIGFELTGYNIVTTAGPALGLLVFAAVIFLTLGENMLTANHLFSMMQWSLTIFLFFSTVVHPWYVTTLVMFSVITGKKFPIVWSLVVILSYAAYGQQPYRENLWLVGAEYLLVSAAMFYDVSVNRNK
jgi:hypothetical protein